jgi:aminopeptidase-like protein
LDLTDLERRLDVSDAGRELHALVERLYPICRSITGDGVRKTLSILAEHVPLEVHEVPSGTPVFDWNVPREWNIKDAYVKDSAGRRVVDFQRSNLHVVGYSVPIHATMPLQELRPRLHSLPKQPDLIPYRNSFYKEDWGFCLSHRELDALEEGEYEVCIDSTLEDGSLTYGELVLPGREREEVLVSCHVCHPSLCNDNLSGISVATHLSRYLSMLPRRHTYRFLFLPVTIGAITWLARNEETVKNVRHGLVLSLLGDAGNFTYKKSRRGDATVDRAVRHVLAHSGADHTVQDFFPYGYDERQFCSPGFDLPVGCLMRTPHGCFPEYHTSGDDLDFVKPASLRGALGTCLDVLEVLEGDEVLVNLNPKCEPQLGRRGIFRALAERKDDGLEMALLWVLNLCDGSRSLLDVAERSGLGFGKIRGAADVLVKHGLLGHDQGT